jgi:MFS family permease
VETRTEEAIAKAGGFFATAARSLEPLKVRNFALLIGGRVTSNMGRNMRVFARALLVLDLTGSPFLLGLVTSSISWSMLVMPFVGGILADRFDRRKLVLITEFSLAALWIATSVVITVGWIQWWHLMITSFTSGVIQSIGRPGHAAMVGTVVSKEKLASAVAIDSVADHWPRAAGIAIAAALVGVLGSEGLFWFTATLQTITGFTLLFMRWKPEVVQAAKQSVRSNVVEGIKYIKKENILLGLVAINVAVTLFSGVGFLMPFFARDILKVSDGGLGLLMLSSTLGVSVGSAAAVAMANFNRRGVFLVAGSVLGTLVSIAFSQSEVFVLSAGLAFFMGIFNTTRATNVEMMMQMLAPREMRGRIMSLRVAIQGFSWIGVLMMGALAEAIGPARTVLIGASMAGAVALVIFVTMPRIPGFR